jgi:hypothetical protein
MPPCAAQEIMRNFPPPCRRRRIHPDVSLLDEVTVASARPAGPHALSCRVVVLFIACANLAGLLLVRVIRRRREIAVRLALGASGSCDVVRQSLLEALAAQHLGGGLLGFGLAAQWALRVGVSFLPETLPRIEFHRPRLAVVGFALSLAVLTGLLCGLIPAFAAARTSVNEALKEGGRTGTVRQWSCAPPFGAGVAELAVALVLLTASGLLLRSFRENALCRSRLPRRSYADRNLQPATSGNIQRRPRSMSFNDSAARKTPNSCRE